MLSNKYRKLPVVIEAVRVPTQTDKPGGWAALGIFLGVFGPWALADDGGIDIQTLEGVMHANPGDWIIKGVKGEFYPCKPDVFAATYEPVEDGVPC